MSKDLAVDRIRDLCNVSRETLDRLAELADALEKWNRKINLVSPSTIPDMWERHFLDSAQILPLIPPDAKQLCDIGTGGGFPGLVLSMLAYDVRPELKATFIESDRRKCAFLQTMIGKFGLSAIVLPERIEAADPQAADIVTSRALASLTQLLGFAERHLSESGRAIFLKGAKYEAEIDEALASWSFDLQKRESETSAEAVVLEISSLRRR